MGDSISRRPGQGGVYPRQENIKKDHEHKNLQTGLLEFSSGKGRMCRLRLPEGSSHQLFEKGRCTCTTAGEGGVENIACGKEPRVCVVGGKRRGTKLGVIKEL